MSNTLLYGSLGATGAPLTSTLVTIDGTLVMAVALMGAVMGGVLLSVAVRRWRSSRRLTVNPVARLRRAAV
jgi:hypothetical protein